MSADRSVPETEMGDAPQAHAHDGAWVCPNCRRESDEEYCPRCGQQRRREGDLSVAVVWRQVIHEAFDVDGRLLGSIKLLLTQPGQLTLDFLEGRRVRQPHPLKMFLLVSAAYFLLSGGPMLRVGWRDTPGTQHVAANQLLSRPSPRVEQLLRHRAEHLGLSYEAFQRKVEGDLEIVLKAAVTAGVVANGLWLALLFRRQRKYLAEHVVMALHVSCFAMVVIVTVEQVRRLLGLGGGRLGGIVTVVVLLYFIAAARRVYGTDGRRLAVASVLMPFTATVVVVGGVLFYLWYTLF